MTNILDYFPLEKPRLSQKIVLEDVVKTLASDTKIVLLEAPVGSGKSAIAVTLARYYGSAHILTPRKGLQDQYFDDFSEHLVLMKGRSGYPCTLEAGPKKYKSIIKMVQEGYVPPPHKESSCAEAPCINSSEIKTACRTNRPCPYDTAIDIANKSNIIVHNLHSFVFQAWYGDKFQHRPIMIIDEAHDIEKIMRDFGTIRFSIPHTVGEWKQKTIPTEFKEIDEWCDWLLEEDFTRFYSKYPGSGKTKETSKLDDYISTVNTLRELGRNFKDRFSTEFETVLTYGNPSIVLKIVPDDIGNLFRKFLLDFCDKMVLMSGTVYEKEAFCRNLGINPDMVSFRRIDSSFPVENRKIYLVKELMVDTSHQKWDENFPHLLKSIKKVMDKFPSVKGLIHSPSYLANQQIVAGLKDKRIITHAPSTFNESLRLFYESKDPLVFLSPICQQGVDFKDDRARFQLILRVPYPSIGDSFVRYKMERDRGWYNYQALIAFGQQIGRINRSETDSGITVLLDERFAEFIRRNTKLPGWLKKAFVYKENIT